MVHVARACLIAAAMVAVTVLTWSATAVAQDGAPVPAAAPAKPKEKRTPELIRAAIQRGVDFLMKSQNQDGMFFSAPDPGLAPQGMPRLPSLYDMGDQWLVLMALEQAGVKIEDPRMRRGIDAAMKKDDGLLQEQARRVIVLSDLLDQFEARQKAVVSRIIAADVQKISEAQASDGQWSSSNRRGLSALTSSQEETQLALEALCAASRAGVKVRPEVFAKAQAWMLAGQRPDGGWDDARRLGGQAPTQSSGGATAWMVAGLVLTRDAPGPAGCPCRIDASDPRQARVEAAIEKANDRLGQVFTVTTDPQSALGGLQLPSWHLALARACTLTGRRFLGTHDWRDDLAAYLLGAQDNSGSWYGVGDSVRLPQAVHDVIAIRRTARTISTLVTMQRGPLLLHKIAVDGQAWNNHPADAPDLAAFVAAERKEPASWDVISAEADDAVWSDAPIAYLSLEGEVSLSDAQTQRLRRFTSAGGTVVFEATCGNRKASAALHTLCAKVWPEWELTPIEKTDLLWSAETRVTRLVAVSAIKDAVRMPVVVFTADISCAWAGGDAKRMRPAFDTGQNLCAIALGGMTLADWHAMRDAPTWQAYADQTKGLKGGAKKDVHVSWLKHGPGWDAAAHYSVWSTLSRSLQEAGLDFTVHEGKVVSPGDVPPQGASALYLSGRKACGLDEAGVKWLKDYLAGGGFLLAEATCGDTEFDTSLRAALGLAGLELRELDSANPLIVGGLFGARGFDLRKARLGPLLAKEMPDRTGPLLFGIYDGTKLVGIYSPWDVMLSQARIAAWGMRGYAAEDARAVATNLALVLSIR